MGLREGNVSFCGWYYRCQSERQTIALIPAVHTAGGARSASLQIISGEGCRSISLPTGRVSASLPRAELPGCVFREDRMRLDLHTAGLDAEGELRFAGRTPLRYDIMGPFRLVPAMECRHSVYSMRHRVYGRLSVDGTAYVFDGADGYIEGDRGRSFPRRYLWTQCFFGGGSLMLSVAEIPLGPARFTGVIGVVRTGGREWRLATYLGARVAAWDGGEVTVRQGGMILRAALLERGACRLRAPQNGVMSRLIRENAACRAHYELIRDGRTLLSLDADNAAFEDEYTGTEGTDGLDLVEDL